MSGACMVCPPGVLGTLPILSVLGDEILRLATLSLDGRINPVDAYGSGGGVQALHGASRGDRSLHERHLRDFAVWSGDRDRIGNAQVGGASGLVVGEVLAFAAGPAPAIKLIGWRNLYDLDGFGEVDAPHMIADFRERHVRAILGVKILGDGATRGLLERMVAVLGGKNGETGLVFFESKRFQCGGRWRRSSSPGWSRPLGSG